MVLPTGFTVPDPVYVLVLFIGLATVGFWWYQSQPLLTPAIGLATLPWMVFGATLRVIERANLLPASLEPLAQAPAVYLTTAILVIGTWLTIARIRNDQHDVSTALAGIGGVVAGIPLIFLLSTAAARGTFQVQWPLAIVIISLFISVLVTGSYRWQFPRASSMLGLWLPAVIGAHVLDGVSTSIGVDVLGVHEQSPLPRMIMSGARRLPVSDTIGVGWSFLLLKLIIAVGIAHLFVGAIEREPSQTTVLLIIVTAVGLGPGVHNLLLFTIGG